METAYGREFQSDHVGLAEDQRLPAAEAAWAGLREYARDYPEVVALWAFGIGFILGWKLKPW
jgi:hypothetical protein